MLSEILNIHVAITGLSAADNPYPGLGIARSLRYAQEFGGSISGLVFEPLSNAAYNNAVFDRIYLVPYPAAGHEAMFDRISEINKKHPVNVIIPALDSEVLIYTQIEKRLNDIGIRLLLPPVSSVKQSSKSLLYEFGLKHDIDVPKTFILNSAEEIRPRSSDTGIPFLLKGVLSDARICRSVEQGESEYINLFDLWGYPILMQQHVAGEEFDVIALADKNSETAGALVMKKFGLTDKGKAFAGVTVEHPALIGITRKILKCLKWVGPVECEFVCEKESGAPHLIEINSRFPSWLYLAAESGQNLPLLTLKLALDIPFEPLKSYQTGKLFFRTVTDTELSPVKLMELAAFGEVHF